MRALFFSLLIFSNTLLAADWTPTIEIEEKAKTVFNQYLANINSSNFEKAYGMHTDAFKQTANFDEWKNHKSQFINNAGDFLSYNNLKFTWYKDPKHAPEKGIYGAIDYQCDFENLGFCSGTVILFSNDDVTFKVMREETNSIGKDILEKLIDEGVLDDNNDIVLKPFKSPKVSEKQWQSYHSAVNIFFPNSRQILPEQGLELFTDRKTGTMYAFTLNNHPAHPSWVTRYIYEKDGSLGIGQTGYFAGEEKPFAELFRQYQALNEQAKQQMSQ